MKSREMTHNDNDLATRLVGEDIVGLGFNDQGDELDVGSSDDDNDDSDYDSNGALVLKTIMMNLEIT
jgi:hypothetical protein